MRTKYTKLLGNLGNALLAVVGLNASPDEQDALFTDVRAEAIRAFDHAGIDYEPWDAFNARATPLVADSKLPGGTPYGGSTWLSLVRKAGSVETDYLNGEIVRLGRASDVPTPLNDALCRVVKEMAERGLEPGAYGVADLRRLAGNSLGTGEIRS
jgi:2-dehydropantoate 2-reductase